MTDGLEAARQAEAKARADVGRWPSDESPEWWAQFAHLLDAYAEAVRATERVRASESALRAAAQEERVLELVSKYVAIGDYWHARGLKSWPIDATVLDRFARASLSILGNAPSSPDMALRAAAQAVIVRGSLVGRCLECWQTDGAHTDKCDLGRLKAALDGAPWEPSE